MEDANLENNTGEIKDNRKKDNDTDDVGVNGNRINNDSVKDIQNQDNGKKDGLKKVKRMAKADDIVISSRARLARNIEGFPFPWKMSAEQGKRIFAMITEALMTSTLGKELLLVDSKDIGLIDKQFLVEKHLISPDMAESKKAGGAIISRDEKISVMVNEEDHLRIQCLFKGLDLKGAFALCNRIDNLLEEKIEFAFNPSLGYITCCPTNLGTGLRASVMLHLPALVITGLIKNILEACGQLNLAVRGIYGENSGASGNMFQISNQSTLGNTEEEAILSITRVAIQIAEQEKNLRTELYKQNPYRFEDRVMRSYGLFTHARIISHEESMKLLSDIRVGVDMGIITTMSRDVLDELMILVQPAGLQKYCGRQLSPEERDHRRAEIIRQKLDL
ncbi:MAG: protein arginine kinase [Clostridiales bacterium]|nr:protein arginine kinase [Clostridiales bacterium]